VLDVEGQGRRIGSHRGAGPHQIMPRTHLDLPPILVEGVHMVWYRCSKLAVFPFAGEGTHLCAESWATLLGALLAQQEPFDHEFGTATDWGFHTHFTSSENRLADPNVETTSVAVLALYRLANPDCPKTMGLPAEK
jgi:hypothetical protein